MRPLQGRVGRGVDVSPGSGDPGLWGWVCSAYLEFAAPRGVQREEACALWARSPIGKSSGL